MFRLSLRELLVLVAFVSLAVASLKHASDRWSTLIFAAIATVFYVSGMVAIASRGPRRAFAMGMVFHMALYAALIGNAGLQTPIGDNPEMSSSGRLPSSWILRRAYDAFADIRYYDTNTGGEVPRAVAEGSSRPHSFAQRSEDPSRYRFLQIGHYWWALLFGYFGGKFSQFIYLRYGIGREPLATESS